MSNAKDKEHKYNEGDIVWALEAPNVKLVVRRYIDKIYYCKVHAGIEKQEKVYFERELMVTPPSK
jgi:hypothetical protein